MILGAWQVLVLVGAGAAYHGFVKKGEGAVFTLLATVGCFSVAGLGSLSLEADHATSQEWGIAILCFVTVSIASIAFFAALMKSGPYADDDDDPSEAGAEEPDSSYLDSMARWMS